LEDCAIYFTSKRIIVKADSLGSLEALLTLLRQARVPVVKASIGNIGKSEIVAAKANLELNPLNAIILGFNVEIESDLEYDKKSIKILTNQVVYKLIEDLEEWRSNRSAEIEKERMMELGCIGPD
jgi:translation initiation factor 5B